MNGEEQDMKKRKKGKGGKKRRKGRRKKYLYTVGTRFNDPERTGDFWSLNPNVKSNF